MSRPTGPEYKRVWPEHPEECLDVMELCGGLATTSRLLVRRGYVQGRNYYISFVLGLGRKPVVDDLFCYLEAANHMMAIPHPP